MFLFVIFSVFLLMVWQMLLGWLWFGVFTAKREAALREGEDNSQGIRRASFMPHLAFFYIALWITLLVLLSPHLFASVAVLFLFLFIFPLRAFQSNLWVRDSSMSSTPNENESTKNGKQEEKNILGLFAHNNKYDGYSVILYALMITSALILKEIFVR